jgi:hypothetical protein
VIATCNKYIERLCDIMRLLALYVEWLQQNSQPLVVPCSLEVRNLTVCLLYRKRTPNIFVGSMQVAGKSTILSRCFKPLLQWTLPSREPRVGNALATRGPEPSHSCRDHSRRHEAQFIKGHYETVLDCASVVRRRTHTVPRVVHDATARVRKPLQM